MHAAKAHGSGLRCPARRRTSISLRSLLRSTIAEATLRGLATERKHGGHASRTPMHTAVSNAQLANWSLASSKQNQAPSTKHQAAAWPETIYAFARWRPLSPNGD